MKDIISIKQYRVITKDLTSSDSKIKERIKYLEAFCRNIIKIELAKVKTKYH